MFRRRELSDLKTHEGWRDAVALLHDSQPIGSYHPLFELWYHTEFGTHEEVKDAEEALRSLPGKYVHL